MAYERTWQFMGIQGPRVAASAADGASYGVWMLKVMLTGEVGGINAGLWTVHGSCDGSTAAMDAVDRWGSTYAVGNVAYTTNPILAHGWIVLKRNFTVYSTTYTVYLTLIAADTIAGNYMRYTVIAALAAPTGGSTTVNPTQTQVIFQNYSNTGGQVVYQADFSNTRRWYGGINSIGDFWFAETIAGEVCVGWYFGQPIGCKTNDQAPFVMFGNYLHVANNGLYPFAGQCLYTRVANYTTPGIGPGMYYNSSVGYPALIQPPPYNLLDTSDVSLFDYPAWVVVGNATTPTASHARGRLPDVGLCTGYLLQSGTIASHRPCNVGTTIRDGGNVAYVTLNQLIVPYNALLS